MIITRATIILSCMSINAVNIILAYGYIYYLRRISYSASVKYVLINSVYTIPKSYGACLEVFEFSYCCKQLFFTFLTKVGFSHE